MASASVRLGRTPATRSGGSRLPHRIEGDGQFLQHARLADRVKGAEFVLHAQIGQTGEDPTDHDFHQHSREMLADADMRAAAEAEMVMLVADAIEIDLVGFSNLSGS